MSYLLSKGPDSALKLILLKALLLNVLRMSRFFFWLTTSQVSSAESSHSFTATAVAAGIDVCTNNSPSGTVAGSVMDEGSSSWFSWTILFRLVIPVSDLSQLVNNCHSIHGILIAQLINFFLQIVYHI